MAKGKLLAFGGLFITFQQFILAVTQSSAVCREVIPIGMFIIADVNRSLSPRN